MCDSFCIGIYYEMIDNLTKEGEILVVFSKFQQFIRIFLQGVGTNAQVSGMCVLHADTSAYLS